jgi:PKD repeat protein
MPDNNHAQIDSIVNFSWNICPNADAYELELSDNPTFSNASIITVSQIDTTLALDTALYYWRVRCMFSGAAGPWSEVRSFTIFNFPNRLVLWLASDSGLTVANNKVSQWNDISGNNHVFLELDTAQQPQLEDTTFSEIPTLHFDGTNDRLYCPSFAVNQPYSIYLVFQSTAEQPFNYIFDGFPNQSCRLGSNSNRRYVLSAGGFFQSNQSYQEDFNFLSYEVNLSNSTIKEDFVELYNVPGNPGTANVTSGFIFGSNGALNQTNPVAFAKFAMSEFIVFDTVLDSINIFRTEAYLRSKYAPPINLGKDRYVDYGFCDVVLSPLAGSYVDYVWSTGETSSSIVTNQPGQYWVVATDTFGFTSSDTVVVNTTVNRPSFSDTTICAGVNILYDTEFPTNNYAFTWYNSTSTDSFANISLENNYAFSITDTNSCVYYSDTFNVNIDSLALNFSLGNDTAYCFGNTISAPSGFMIDSYLWSTGDTTNFTSFQNQGNYWISVINSNACSTSDTVFITSLGTAPTPNFSYTFGCANTPIAFYDSSSANSSINYWEWDFGDSNASLLQNPNHSFSAPGNYIVELYIATSGGCFNSIQKTITIPENPTANFDYSIPCAGSITTFLDQSLGNIIQWSWINNSSPTQTTQVAELAFSSPGLEPVTLVVTDSLGCVDSISQTIEVFPALLPDFEVSGVCIGDTTHFTETTPSFSVIDREWRFGLLNQSSSIENPSFFYPNSGLYSVNLRVENAIGCVSDTTKIVEIRNLPVIELLAENSCIGTQSTLIDQSQVLNGVIVDQVWEVEGNTLYGDSVNYIFDDIQTYIVSLQVEDNFGCANQDTSLVEVYELPEVDFSFSPNYGEAPIDISFSNQSSANAVDFFWDFGDGVGTSIEEEPVYSYSTNGTYTILLRGSTAEGCADSSFKEIPIIPTELDIALSNFSIQKTTLADGSLAYQPSVLLQNVGTRAIFNAELLLSVNNETSIAETWEGILPVGQSVFYTLDNFALIKILELLDYLCLEAGYVNDNTEINLNNNKTCLIQKGSIQTSLPYPIPGQNEVNIDVIMENDDELSIEIYDLNGRLVLSSKNLALLEGYNKLSIETSTLQAGKYIVFLNYNDEIISHSLIIENP